VGDRRDVWVGESGQTIVEYVLVVVLFVMLLFLALESANLSDVLDTSANTLQDHLIANE